MKTLMKKAMAVMVLAIAVTTLAGCYCHEHYYHGAHYDDHYYGHYGAHHSDHGHYY